MDDILHAIRETVPYGHAAKLADMIGMSQKILSNKVNPYNEHHHITAMELVRLMKAANDYRALHAIADHLGFKCERKSPHPEENIVTVILKMEAEHGDVSRAMSDALADGRLTPREKEKVLKEIEEAIDALVELRESTKNYK